MTRQIIAFFATSFIFVAFSIPSEAQEKSGVVARIDRDARLMTFADGTTCRLPGAFDYEAIRPGMEVHVILDESGPGEAARAA